MSKTTTAYKFKELLEDLLELRVEIKKNLENDGVPTKSAIEVIGNYYNNEEKEAHAYGYTVTGYSVMPVTGTLVFHVKDNQSGLVNGQSAETWEMYLDVLKKYFRYADLSENTDVCKHPGGYDVVVQYAGGALSGETHKLYMVSRTTGTKDEAAQVYFTCHR